MTFVKGVPSLRAHTQKSVCKFHKYSISHSMGSLTLIMENEFRHKRMSHYVINHAQGRAHSDHLWQVIKQGA